MLKPWVSCLTRLPLILFIASIGVQAEAHSLGSATTEVLDPLPPAGRMVAADGAGLFVSAGPQAAAESISAQRGFIKRSTIRQIDSAYRDRMMLAPVVGKAAAARSDAPDPIPSTVGIFSLPLFDDTTVKLYKTGMSKDALGSTVITARVLNPEGGEATIVLHDGHMAGAVRLGARTFAIEPTSDGRARIVETDPDQRPHVDPLKPARVGVPVARAPASASSTPATADAALPSTIDILIGYTPAAAASNADIASAISLAISYTNQVMTQSGIGTQFNLVGTTELNYDEAGKQSDAILTDLQAGTGGFAAAHTMRDTLQADLVQVWTAFTDACGISYVLEEADQQNDSDFGYSTISTSFGNGCLTDAVAHEIGHNLGSKHDRYVDDRNDQLTTQFNFGYVDIANRIRTIMSYPDACENAGITDGCAIIPYHSSPALTFQGHVLGIADTQPNSADNVTKIKQILPFVAQFRTGAAQTTLVSALLPLSRSVQVDTPFSFFMTLINAGAATANNCRIGPFISSDALTPQPSASVSFQTTDPATNALTGSLNTPVSIPADGVQSFVVFATVSNVVSGTFQPSTSCDNAGTPARISGVNALILTTSTTPVPDVIAVAATGGGNGIVAVPTGGVGAFAVATTDIGAAGAIVASVDTGGYNLPATLTICETNPATSQCLAPPASTVVHNYTTGDTPTFSIFAVVTQPITFNPATSRILVHFSDAAGGVSRGATSVAIDTF
jgi:hypothetical protein